MPFCPESSGSSPGTTSRTGSAGLPATNSRSPSCTNRTFSWATVLPLPSTIRASGPLQASLPSASCGVWPAGSTTRAPTRPWWRWLRMSAMSCSRQTCPALPRRCQLRVRVPPVLAPVLVDVRGRGRSRNHDGAAVLASAALDRKRVDRAVVVAADVGTVVGDDVVATAARRAATPAARPSGGRGRPARRGSRSAAGAGWAPGRSRAATGRRRTCGPPSATGARPRGRPRHSASSSRSGSSTSFTSVILIHSPARARSTSGPGSSYSPSARR